MVIEFSEPTLAHFVQTQMRNGGWKKIAEYGRLTAATYSTASAAALLALGDKWSLKHIGRAANGCVYFGANKAKAEELHRHISRVTEFGELIFNLHSVTGFDERIDAIRRDEKSGIESGIAELIAGMFFRLTGTQFQ